MNLIDETEEETESDVYHDIKIELLHTLANNINSSCCPFAFNKKKIEQFDNEEWCNENYETELTFSVTDNGPHGDGLALNLNASFTQGEDDYLVHVRLSPRQAVQLARALLAVASMRGVK